MAFSHPSGQRHFVAQLTGVGVSLGGRPILRDIDFTLEPGQVVGVAGPNGSGKTTLARVFATLLPIDRGWGSVLRATLGSNETSEIRTGIGLISHQPALIGQLTLEENLIHVARLSGIEEGRVRRALEVVGLDAAAERRVDACSFGMRRRAEIAHLLLTKPDLLLLDEAASGLDEPAQLLIDALLDGVRGRGGGAVVVSHDRRQLEGRCDVVMAIRSGELSV